MLWTEDPEGPLYGHPRLHTAGRNGTTYITRHPAGGRWSRSLVLGTSNEGRHLLVVVSEAADGRDFVVTARDMTDHEKRLFREKGQ